MMPQPEHPSSTLRPLHDIVAGCALDERNGEVLAAAAALAQAVGARLHGVHAAELEPLGAGAEYPAEWLSPALGEAIVAERRRELLHQLRGTGLPESRIGSLEVEIDAPHRALLRAARKVSADLLVVGATAGGRLGRLFGSTADRVTRKAICPVLVIRSPLPVPPHKVLAPVDLSLPSADAFRCGLSLLAQLGGEEASTTVETLFVLDLERQRQLSQFSPEQIERFARGELARFVADNDGGSTLSMERRLRRGEAREEILRQVEESSPDLVLLGTHGHGGLDRLLLGSVASEVMREVRVSVLLIPPAASLGAALAEAVAAETAPVWHLPEPPAGHPDA